MSNPSKPKIDYSYTGFQQEFQDNPFPGTQLDNDLASLVSSADQTINALADIRRADGALINGIVTADSLAEDLLIGLKTPEPWETTHRYVVLDCIVSQEPGLQGVYRCAVSHESADFSDDLAAGYWELIFLLSPDGLGLAPVAISGAYADLTGKPTLGTAAAQNVDAFATAASGTKADTAMQPAKYDPQGKGGDAFPYDSKSAAAAAVIPAAITTVHVNGLGPYSDANNGSTDTFTSNENTRTWYRVADVNYSRIGAEIKAEADVLFTVGSGGNFATINAALSAASKLVLRSYKANGFTVEVRLLAGFVMAEQVIVKNGMDLGFVTITSVGATVTITRSALTTLVYTIDQSKDLDSPRSVYPSFSALNGSKLPKINCLFLMDTSGSGSQRIGIFCAENSEVCISVGRGVTNAGGNGLELYASRAFANGCNFSGATGAGVYVNNRSDADVSYGTFDNCEIGIYGHRSGNISARGAKARNCSDCGIKVHHGGHADATYSDVSGALGDGGYYARHGGRIDADTATATGCVRGGYAHDGGILSMDHTDVSSCTYGILSEYGGRITAPSLKANNCTSYGAWVTNGGEIFGALMNVQNAGAEGLRASSCGRIVAPNAIALNAGSYGASVYSGGKIDTYLIQLTAGKETNVAFNTVQTTGSEIRGNKL